MTKKLFLAAASVAALALAGGANAGTISGVFNAGAVDPLDHVEFDSVKPYYLAKELVVNETDKVAGSAKVIVALDNSIVVPTGAQREHLVTFEVTGADVDYGNVDLTTNHPADATKVTSTFVGNNSAGKPQFLLTISDGTVSELTFEFDLEQSAQASVVVTTATNAVIGADKIAVDSSTATIASYKNVLSALTGDAGSELVARLDDYILLGSSYASAGLLGDTFKGADTAETFYSDFDGDVVEAGDIIKDATVTFTGPVLDANIDAYLYGSAGKVGTKVVGTTAINTSVWDLTNAEAASLVDGSGLDAVIEQLTPGGATTAFREGTYKMTFTPTAKPGFTVGGDQTVTLATVSLDGSHFIAPWVSGTGLATSVIRVSNSNGADSGEVSIRLENAVKVTDGAAVPYTPPVGKEVLILEDVIPAGGDLQINSKMLTDYFGGFTRGDVRVTIKSSDSGFTAKMRSTRGENTFEQSLSN